MGADDPRHGVGSLSVHLLDTTALIAHLRGDEDVSVFLLDLLAEGHTLGTSCINVAELERGLRPRERKAAEALLDRLDFLVTTREAARRAGRYQADFQQRGVTLHTADALVAGTARAYGAVLVTHNLADFPMADVVKVAEPPTVRRRGQDEAT